MPKSIWMPRGRDGLEAKEGEEEGSEPALWVNEA